MDIMDVNLKLFLPELFVTFLAFAVMIADLVMPSGQRKGLARFGIIGSIVTINIIAINADIKGTTLFGLFIQDSVSIFFKILFLLSGIFILYMGELFAERIKNLRVAYN